MTIKFSATRNGKTMVCELHDPKRPELIKPETFFAVLNDDLDAWEMNKFGKLSGLPTLTKEESLQESER